MFNIITFPIVSLKFVYKIVGFKSSNTELDNQHFKSNNFRVERIYLNSHFFLNSNEEN